MLPALAFRVSRIRRGVSAKEGAMSLQPQAVYVVPEDTARVARAAFPKGNAYLRMHDELGRLYADRDFAALFQLLARCRAAGLLRARGRQRSDSTAVLAALRTLNRLELVDEALRHALHALAAVVPDWLRRQCPADWPEHYGPRLGDYRLPLDLAARQALAAQLGADGRQLLLAVWAPSAPAWLHEIPAVEALRQIWVQQYYA